MEDIMQPESKFIKFQLLPHSLCSPIGKMSSFSRRDILDSNISTEKFKCGRFRFLKHFLIFIPSYFICHRFLRLANINDAFFASC